jgi:hypothetical protein
MEMDDLNKDYDDEQSWILFLLENRKPVVIIAYVLVAVWPWIF